MNDTNISGHVITNLQMSWTCC